MLHTEKTMRQEATKKKLGRVTSNKHKYNKGICNMQQTIVKIVATWRNDDKGINCGNLNGNMKYDKIMATFAICGITNEFFKFIICNVSNYRSTT